MTIKDVEKLTGLTAKAIRYYEQQGLICIDRDKMNSYRNYLEKDVNVLRKIKLFRYLDFSIEEIKSILQMENEQISKALNHRAEIYEEKIAKDKSKKEICLDLSKEYKKGEIQLEEYEELIQFEENEEIKEIIENIQTPSIYGLIFEGFILLGPIISLFINIKIGIKDIILAIIATVILTLSCKKYIYYYKNRRSAVKKRNKEDKHVIPMLLISIVLSFAMFALYAVLIEKILAPQNWLFYQINHIYEILMLVSTLFSIIMLLQTALKLIKKEKINLKLLILVLVVWLIGLYSSVTNVTFVTEENIICYSPFNLSGKQYNYSDVSKVEAKFNKKGDFQYVINIEGKELIFSFTTANSQIQRYADSYLELEEFDAKLMELNIPKDSDETNSELCVMDKIYVDRFFRIIKNKEKYK